MIQKETLKNLKLVFLAMFFFSLYIALTSYVNSSFMEELGIGKYINGIYFFSSLFAVGALWSVPFFIKKFGTRVTMITLLMLSLTSLLGLLLSVSPFLHIFFFLILLILNFVIIFQMDVFLNRFSDTEYTGRIRGLFFTLINFTWAISSLIAGYGIDTFGMKSIYGLGVMSICITSIVFFSHFKKVRFEVPPLSNPFIAYKKMTENRDKRNIFSLSFLLHSFYAMAIIYLPYHLHYVIGFSWIDIGFLLLIANLPFLLLEYPVGKIADVYLGEQELMITGLAIAALGTFGFALVSTPSILLWSFVLILSRIGIALLETTTESYFFKIIDKQSIEQISIQRTVIPLAYVFVPLLGFIVSFFFETSLTLFILIGIFLLIGIYPAARIHDTK